MRNLLGTSNNTDLINSANLRAQTAVNAENFTINNGSEDKEVKNLAARLPDRRIAVFLLALLVETVNLGNLARLVVAADECDLVGVPLNMLDVILTCLNEYIHSLQAHQQGKGLQAKIATIDEVTKEDKVLITTSRDLIDAANARITTRAATTA